MNKFYVIAFVVLQCLRTINCGAQENRFYNGKFYIGSSISYCASNLVGRSSGPLQDGFLTGYGAVPLGVTIVLGKHWNINLSLEGYKLPYDLRNSQALFYESFKVKTTGRMTGFEAGQFWNFTLNYIVHQADKFDIEVFVSGGTGNRSNSDLFFMEKTVIKEQLEYPIAHYDIFTYECDASTRRMNFTGFGVKANKRVSRLSGLTLSLRFLIIPEFPMQFSSYNSKSKDDIKNWTLLQPTKVLPQVSFGWYHRLF